MACVGDLLFVSSSSLAGVSPVRVAARRPGSRLAASVWKRVRVEAQRRKPCKGERLSGPQHEAKPAASLEVLPVRVGTEESRAAEIRVKAMEAVKNLECSREEPSGVWGVERSDSDDGNWGGPPRPGDLRWLSPERRRPITGDPGKWDVVPGGRRRRP